MSDGKLSPERVEAVNERAGLVRGRWDTLPAMPPSAVVSLPLSQRTCGVHRINAAGWRSTMMQ